MVVRAYDKSHRMMRSRKQRDVPQPDGLRHRQADRRRVRLSARRRARAAARSTSCSRTTRPTGTSSGGSRGASASSSSSTDDTRRASSTPERRASEVELAYPDDLHAFRPRITSVQQVEKVNVRGFDLKSQAGRHEHEEHARAAHRGRHHAQRGRRDVRREHARDRRAVVQLARARPTRSRRRCSTSSPTPTSPPRAAPSATRRSRPGVKLKITGVGTNFSGTYRVAKAVHVLQQRRLRHASSPTRSASTRCSGRSSCATATCRAASTRSSSASSPTTTTPRSSAASRSSSRSVSEQETFWAPVLLPRRRQGARDLDAARSPTSR